MWCCVSRAVAGADQGPPYDQCSSKVQPAIEESEKLLQVEHCSDPDVLGVLLPCAICARTFMPQSLEKHARICEQSAGKKRKPFDSAKQRIQGTELAEFVPRQRRRHCQDDRTSKPKSAWKQTHDDLLRAVRAARNEIAEPTMQKQCNSMATPSAPTRANEQGMCPTCNRHFGVKAFDRHVAWCKERIARVTVSPATNIAKERLEARMKYRAPALKNRRQTTRDKYSPGSAATLTSGSKTSPNLPSSRAKESSSAPSCHKANDSPVKQKPAVARRPGQAKESSPLGRTKPRPIDGTNRPPEDEAGPPPFRPAPPSKRTSHLPVPPLKHKKEGLEECRSTPIASKRQRRKTEDRSRRDEPPSSRVKQEDRHQPLHSARSQKASIVSARSQGHPKVNDVSINADVIGVTVKPCHIYRGNEFTTWRRISEEKDQQTRGGSRDAKPQNPKDHSDASFPDHSDPCLAEFCLNERLLEDEAMEAASTERAFKDRASKLSSRSGSVNWSAVTPSLNRTYSFKDSMYDDADDATVTGQRTWRPVKHSPRIEFRLGDPSRVDRLHSSSYSCTGFAELGANNGAGNSRANFKGGNVERGRSGNCGIEDERKADGSKEGNLDVETSTQELPTESFKSAKGRILERKRLRSTGYRELSQETNYEGAQDCSDDSRIVNSQERMAKGEDKESDCGNSEMVCVSSEDGLKEEDVADITRFSEQKLQASIFSEQLGHFERFDDSSDKCNGIFNDETREQGVDQSTSYDDKGTSETVRTWAIEKENDDVNIDVEDVEAFQDELEPSATNQEACIQVNLEAEIDPFLMNDTLHPAGSSTPFNALIEDSRSKRDVYENLRGKSPSPLKDCEWKMAIDAEKGSEMLYRVESSSSNHSSSSIHAKLDEPEKTDRENRTVEPRSGSSNRASRLNTTTRIAPSVPPAIQTEERAAVETALTKDISSQMNTRDSSSNVSLDFKCKSVANESDEVTWDFDCDDSLKEKSAKKCRKVAEGSSKRQAHVDLKETDAGPKPDRPPKKLRNPNLRGNLGKKGPGLNSKSKVSAQPTVDADRSVNEEVLEIYKSSTCKGFDYDSDNTVEEEIMGEGMVRDDRIDVRNLRSIIFSESRVEMKKSSTSRSTAVTRRSSKALEIEDKIRESMNILNEGTDSSASSNDGVDLADVQQVESVEVETIEEIGTRNRSVRFRILPEIKQRAKVAVDGKYREEKLNSQTYWEKAKKATRNRLINLDPPSQGANRFLKRNPKICVLPPVPSNASLISGKDYDPFLLAEQQMNDLLSDTSEQSVTDGPPRVEQNRDALLPLSHSSAFVRYPYSVPEKRSSLIAPPNEFDDPTTDFSSDSTETNSLSREAFLKDGDEFGEPGPGPGAEKASPARELGRRVIIDRSRALGGGVVGDAGRGARSFVGGTERARKVLGKVSPKVVRPAANRSLSARASSAPKAAVDRNAVDSSDPRDPRISSRKCEPHGSPCASLNGRNNNYGHLSSSNLSLSSIVSSDVDIKRSNSVFDELMASYEDGDASFPSLKSLLKHDSLSTSSPVQGRQRNNQASDEELSSPESYKRQDRGKLSADSAYSSLNRKYSNHGRSANDVAGRLEEEAPRNNRRDGDGARIAGKCKMSKFCHECGSKFPETAKFCCECGLKRLVL